MIINGVKTRRVEPGQGTIFKLLDEFLPELSEKCVVAVASKIVSTCEGRVVPLEQAERDDLVRREAELYLPNNDFGFAFTITKKTLIPVSGIDESNGAGHYILWPAEPQKSANAIREHLAKKHGLKHVGVVITDSSVTPLRYGTMGIVVSHSGFLARHDYRGQPDLFGREMKVSVSSVAGGLAAAAVTVMGEGTEQTPLAVIEEVPFVQFQDRNPTQQELDDFYIPMGRDDLFAPFLTAVDWLPGGQQKQ